jgi:hypothetical protein
MKIGCVVPWCPPARHSGSGAAARTCRGAALMEVLLALALFVAAAAVVTSALSASMDSLDRQRMGVHALDLATSTLAEMQMGVRPVTAESPQALAAPFQDWTREVLVSPLEAEGGEVPALVRVEVVVRHATAPIVQRLAQAFPPSGSGSLLSSPSSLP